MYKMIHYIQYCIKTVKEHFLCQEELLYVNANAVMGTYFYTH